LKAQDTTELFYDDVRLPAANLLGEEGKAFEYLTRNLLFRVVDTFTFDFAE
jgi:acyl-CoA dehydrogenase